jgi:hypothetical protein
MASGAGATVHVVRFYVPALAAVALLAAWLVQQFPRWVPVAVLAAAITLGLGSYSSMAKAGRGGPGGPAARFGGGHGGGFPGTPPQGVPPGGGPRLSP